MVCKSKKKEKIKRGQCVIQVERKISEYANSIRVVLAHICLITQY
jgi:hypothetical protein